jgi:hypothetical protein
MIALFEQKPSKTRHFNGSYTIIAAQTCEKSKFFDPYLEVTGTCGRQSKPVVNQKMEEMDCPFIQTE